MSEENLGMSDSIIMSLISYDTGGKENLGMSDIIIMSLISYDTGGRKTWECQVSLSLGKNRFSLGVYNVSKV